MERDDLLFTALVVVTITIGIVVAFLMPYFEAKNFNQCTGSNATYFTALTTQLRINECIR